MKLSPTHPDKISGNRSENAVSKQQGVSPAGDRYVTGMVQSCQKGDQGAQRALYDHFAPRMFAICLRYADDYHSAEDLLQEGWIKVFRYIKDFRAEGSFEGWLRRIFVNTAIEKYRRKHYLYPLREVENTDLEVQDQNVLDSLAVGDLMVMINELSPGYKTVFNLYVVEGYPHREIADMLNISEGTSKSQLARARYILQQKLEAVAQDDATIELNSKVIGE